MQATLSQKFNIDLFLKELASMEGIITSKMLYDLWTQLLLRRTIEIGLKQRYTAKGLPIQSRKIPEHTEVNNKINCDFRGDIVDMFTGYLLGNPIKYTIKPERYEKGQDDPQFIKDTEFFDSFLNNNYFDDIDLETAKNQSICGRGARLCYIGTEILENGRPDYRVIDIEPYECVFIYNPTTNELDYSARFYTVYEANSVGDLKSKIQVEFYDKKYVHYYISDYEKKNFISNREMQLHGFDYVPLFEVPNNNEKIGDFEKVEKLIDAYDMSISDSQNEFEAFRLAYKVFTGAKISENDLKRAKQIGAYELHPGETVAYLTKLVDTAFIKDHFERLTDDIYRFSKTIDTSSDTFTGSGASGEARKWALLPLENKGTIKVNKFKKALNYQFKVLSSAWNKIGITITPEKLNIHFDRNIPVELKSESEIAKNFKGIISDRTMLSLLSFINNPDDELARIEDENKSLAINPDSFDDNKNDELTNTVNNKDTLIATD